MIFPKVFAAAVALASVATADYLPANHVLWGREGRPTSLEKRQVASTRTSSSSTRLPSTIPSSVVASASSVKASSSSSAAVATTSSTPDKACSNGALTRSCWGNGFSISTDFDEKWPDTGKTVRYDLEIAEAQCAPDGITRQCMLINGIYPGPVIEANWGDHLEIHVKNSLKSNGTGIHWHGIRQLNSVYNDGVPGITECPIAPGDTKIYKFQATQYGTTWYHSHYTVQYGDGVLGTIKINGPATQNYDIDLGTFPVSDWYSPDTIWQFYSKANASIQAGGGPPSADNILVNGTAKNTAGGGKYGTTTLTKGKKHRLRLINTSTESAIRVTLDGHPFTVISSDLTPVKPFATNSLLMLIGQRYDVVINANATSGNYWFRAEAVAACASAAKNVGRGIFRYSDGPTTGDPTSTGFTVPADCAEPYSSLVPWWQHTIPKADFEQQAKTLEVDLAIPGVTGNGQNLVVWTVNFTSIRIDWNKPSLQYIADKNNNIPETYNVIEIKKENIWTFWIMQEPASGVVRLPHPLHLHGHDTFILGQGTGIFDANNQTMLDSLQFVNPPRRDVTNLPAGGWVVFAFETDNPGAWLMHCHIASHIGAGLGVQFIEGRDTIPAPASDWTQNCAKWNTFAATAPFPQDDSGL